MLSHYEYAGMLPFEWQIDTHAWTKVMSDSLQFTLSLSVAYVALIHIGERLMRDRKPFELKRALLVWNICLAVFSLLGCCRLLPEFYWAVTSNSFEFSMCTSESFNRDVAAFWCLMFALSKVAEFGDTFFMVLRKRPVSFLHWYHHTTVLVYTWHAIGEQAGGGRWFVTMNYTVHAVMYSYYALRAAGVNSLPKWLPMSITCMQLAQMIMGIVINVNSARIKFFTDRHCQQSNENLLFSAFMYTTYMLMFANFFHKAYLTRDGKHHILRTEPARVKVD